MSLVIETAATLGLLLLLGGSSLRYLLGAGGTHGSDVTGKAAKRGIFVMAAGLSLVTLTSFALQREPLVAAGQIALAGAFFAAHGFGTSGGKVSNALAMVAALSLIGLQAVTSHAADEPGLLPLLCNAAHWIAAVIWGGGLLHLLLLPWPAILDAGKAADGAVLRLPRRYAIMALGMLALLAVTGGLLAFIHIHDAGALNSSVYGTAFKFKAGVALLLTVTVSLDCLRFAPACNTATGVDDRLRSFHRFRVLLGVEGLLLFAAIVSTGALASGNPPGVAPFLNPQSWTMTAGDTPLRVDLQPVAGRAGRVRVEIAAASADDRFPDGTLAVFSMVMPSGSAGRRDVEAIPIGPAAFLGETTVAMPGDWRVDLTLDFPDRAPVRASHTLSIPGPPLERDMRAYLRAATIAYSRAHILTFCVGMLLVAVALWSTRLSFRRRAPAWLMPASLLNAAFGGYLLLSVTFVKTYPSSFRPNPEPYTAAVIQEGERIYRDHCGDCHGLAGRGDGPWAVAERGSIPDLTAPHMDSHTDGEIYWWIRYGIPSLDMPPLGDELSERERWTVINFLRSLRHGMPPRQ